MEQIKLGIYKLKEVTIQEIVSAYKHCLNQIQGGSIEVQSIPDTVELNNYYARKMGHVIRFSFALPFIDEIKVCGTSEIEDNVIKFI